MTFLKRRGITPVFATNHDWRVTIKNTGKSHRFQDLLEAQIGPMPFYVAERGEMPWKPRADAVKHILADQGWSNREVLYVGNSDDDMKTARNGGVLFLNALWHGEANPYGYRFQSAKDIARYVDCLCLGLDNWFWMLVKGDLRVYALAPFTTVRRGHCRVPHADRSRPAALQFRPWSEFAAALGHALRAHQAHCQGIRGRDQEPRDPPRFSCSSHRCDKQIDFSLCRDRARFARSGETRAA